MEQDFKKWLEEQTACWYLLSDEQYEWYLNSCMPVVANGFLIECDLCYCEWCSCYDDCMNGGVDDEASEL